MRFLMRFLIFGGFFSLFRNVSQRRYSGGQGFLFRRAFRSGFRRPGLNRSRARL